MLENKANAKRKYWFGTWAKAPGGKTQRGPDLLDRLRKDEGGLTLKVYQEELSLSNYAHYQFVVGFAKPVDFRWWRNQVQLACGIKVWVKGIDPKDLVKCVKYCMKADTRVVGGKSAQVGAEELLKSGNKGTKGKRVDIIEAAKFFKEYKGKITDVPEEHIEAYAKYSKYFDKLNAAGRVNEEVSYKYNIWLHGPTGTGKTYRAIQMAKMLMEKHGLNGYYVKKSSTKWWDMYDGQEIVIVDDVRPYESDMELMSEWLQLLNPKSTLQVQVKGGAAVVRAKYFIFTSPAPPGDWFLPRHGADEASAQISRRFQAPLGHTMQLQHVYKPAEELEMPPPQALADLATYLQE